MLKREEIIRDLERTGALLRGHFLLTSGLHSGAYVQCASLLKYPDLAEKFCRELAGRVEEYEVELVLGPALGGVLVAYETARALGVPGIFTERKEGKMKLRRNFEIKPGQRVLVVEDVVTTGGSVREVIEIVKERKGKLLAVASLIDRSKGQADFGVPFVSLVSLDIKTYKPEECPLCQQGSQAVKPGSRV
ncbi:MAG TPA: orotate phosphoribosyltransferase [Halanaerobiales bacterium]|nr:orotate phosphoribosyltransferase [Halanaerobiales bacterium]